MIFIKTFEKVVSYQQGGGLERLLKNKNYRLLEYINQN
jgi:hypothetical protein